MVGFHTVRVPQCIQQAEETPTAKLLREANECHANLSFELDAYEMNMYLLIDLFFNYI